MDNKVFDITDARCNHEGPTSNYFTKGLASWSLKMRDKFLIHIQKPTKQSINDSHFLTQWKPAVNIKRMCEFLNRQNTDCKMYGSIFINNLSTEPKTNEWNKAIKMRL